MGKVQKIFEHIQEGVKCEKTSLLLQSKNVTLIAKAKRHPLF